MTTQYRQAKQLVQVTIGCALMLVGSLYGQAPTITGFTPASGPVGTLLKVSGTNLATPTHLILGGTSAVVVSSDATEIVALVMPGSGTGTISVSTALGTTTSNNAFAVTPSSVPAIQQGSKLVGSASSFGSEQGHGVSLSADGNTLAVGGFDDENTGSVWVYTRNNGVWSQQGNKFRGTGTSADSFFGYAVDLSADGNTLAVGGYNDNSGTGAVWVFTRSGSTWTQQGSKLIGTGAASNANQGVSVALSADGNTLLVGGSQDNFGSGAAWVFTRSAGVWTQQDSKLVGTGAVGPAGQGFRVDLSADGKTSVLGAVADNSNAGAGWVFTRQPSGWAQQGPKLVGTGATGSARQGVGVALSADGNTLLLGGRDDNSNLGATWAFVRDGVTWSQQGSKLVGSDASGASRQGYVVSLSADGNTALISGYEDNFTYGTAWVFVRNSGAQRNGAVWTQSGPKLVGTGGVGSPRQGAHVSLSANGETAALGGDDDNGRIGATWIFVKSVVTSIEDPQWGTRESELRLTPNPLSLGQLLLIALPARTSPSDFLAEVISSDGRVVAMHRGRIEAGADDNLSLNLDQLAPSSYVVRLTMGQSAVKSGRLIITR